MADRFEYMRSPELKAAAREVEQQLTLLRTTSLKYIDSVGASEGDSFARTLNGMDDCTAEEKAVLQSLFDELDARDAAIANRPLATRVMLEYLTNVQVVCPFTTCFAVCKILKDAYLGGLPYPEYGWRRIIGVVVCDAGHAHTFEGKFKEGEPNGGVKRV